MYVLSYHGGKSEDEKILQEIMWRGHDVGEYEVYNETDKQASSHIVAKDKKLESTQLA